MRYRGKNMIDNEKRKKELIAVENFCRNWLNIPFETEIDVEIHDLKSEGVMGWTHGDDGEFTIELEETLTNEEALVTFCHEMVHVMQHVEGKEISEDEAYNLENVLADAFNATLGPRYSSPVPCFGLAGL